MTTNMYDECIDMVRSLAGGSNLYFEAPLEVRLSPHSFPFSAWAVCIGPQDRLALMDGSEEWHEIEKGNNSDLAMLASLYQRLKLMRINYAKAS